MLFTFPSRYWFTIGCRVVLSLGRWSSQIPAGFHVSRGTRVPVEEFVKDGTTRPPHFAYEAITRYGATFQYASAMGRFCNSLGPLRQTHDWPHDPDRRTPASYNYGRFRLIPVRSPLLRESLLVSFPEGTKMFQFPSFASLSGYRRINAGGLPHSEISGSMPVSGSPKLIAAFRVLHRLSAPRHPPCALSSLTTIRIRSLRRVKTKAHFANKPHRRNGSRRTCPCPAQSAALGHQCSSVVKEPGNR